MAHPGSWDLVQDCLSGHKYLMLFPCKDNLPCLLKFGMASDLLCRIKGEQKGWVAPLRQVLSEPEHSWWCFQLPAQAHHKCLLGKKDE